MSEEKSDFFHCPAYKLMISDIRFAVPKRYLEGTVKDAGEVRLGEEGNVECEWFLEIGKIGTRRKEISLKSGGGLKGLKLHLKLVWIQGTVMRMEAAQDTEGLSLVISDEEDGKEEAIIYEYNTVPGGDHPDIKIGSYVGTLGQIWSTDPVIVKATKVMYLSDKPLCKAVWRDEVILAKAFLAGMILPSLPHK